MIRQALKLTALSLMAAAAVADDGKQIFENHCTSCHQSDGKGIPGTFPPLKDNAALKDKKFLIAVLLNGMNRKIEVNGKTYHGQMPDWSSQLSDRQIAAVASYVSTGLNGFSEISEADVKQVKSSGTKPAALLPSSEKPSRPTSSGSAPSADRKSPGSGPSGTSKHALGNQEMDSKALIQALKDVRYNPPFIAEVEQQHSEFGEMVKLGYLIMVDTQNYAPNYTKGGLNCSNCHLQGGAQSDSAPLWGAYPNYPTYRGKNHLINSYANRLQGCWMYSMNGIAPPADGQVLEALGVYSAWLSQGLPVGMSPQGRGYPEVKNFSNPDPEHGRKLYQQRCAICHGDDGQGTKITGGGRGYQFPPLWGPDSYNWGAGMHRQKHFRNFIRANMPLGQGGTLSDQDAADIAAFVDQPAHARPTRVHNPGQAPNF